jgi:P-type Cu+ transporter
MGPARPGEPGGPVKAQDPICHMSVDTERAKFVSERGGEKVYFCSAACQAQFEAQGRR